MASVAKEIAGVVVVGGGLSGLTVAYRLKQAGFDVIVYEARDRLGGRVYTDYWPDGSYVELGGERIDSDGDHQAIVDLCNELGVELIQESWPTVPIVIDNKIADPKLVSNKLSIAREEFKEVLARESSERLQSLTIGQFIDTFFSDSVTRDILKTYYQEAAERNLNDFAYSYFLEALEEAFIFDKVSYVESYGPYLNYFIKASNALGLTSYFESVADMNTFFKYRIKGGNIQLVDALAREVGEGHIYLSHELTSVRQIEGGHYKLVFDTSDGVKLIDAEKVVISLPTTVLREKKILHNLSNLSPYLKDVLDFGTVRYDMYSKIIIPIQSAPWRDAGFDTMVGLDVDRGCSIWDSSFGQEKASITLFFQGLGIDKPYEKGQLTPKKLSDIVEIYDNMGFKKDPSREVKFYDWGDDDYALGAYSTGVIGQELSQKYPEFWVFADPIEDSLFFTGEHTLIKSGFLNSAVESGNFTANIILSPEPEESVQDPEL